MSDPFDPPAPASDLDVAEQAADRSELQSEEVPEVPAEEIPGELTVGVPAEPVAEEPEVPAEPVAEEPEVPAEPPVLRESGGRSLARREARTKALEMLFAADLRQVEIALVLEQQSWVDDFTRLLVEMVAYHQAELDPLIEEWAEGWTLERMPAVDRNVLRLGLVELLHVDGVPPKVAIDEAVELAKQLSTDSSPRFVNGVLAALARERGLV